MRTLVLNAGYEPLAVISFRRALVLVMNQKAAIVAADLEHPVTGSTSTYDRPSVIILTRTSASRTRGSSRCPGVVCSAGTRTGARTATARDDHRPRAAAVARGEDSWENLVACCLACNNAKATAPRRRWGAAPVPAEGAARCLVGPCAGIERPRPSGTSTWWPRSGRRRDQGRTGGAGQARPVPPVRRVVAWSRRVPIAHGVPIRAWGAGSSGHPLRGSASDCARDGKERAGVACVVVSETPWIDDDTIADLRARLRATRWPDVPRHRWSLGVDVDELRALVEYWADGFDFDAHRAQLAAPALARRRDGIGIHVLHARAATDRCAAGPARARLADCGWRYRKCSPMLVDAGFDVVVPDMPGYGFSAAPPRVLDARQVAGMWATLMTDLGYERSRCPAATSARTSPGTSRSTTPTGSSPCTASTADSPGPG